jgi:hypothetical protein
MYTTPNVSHQRARHEALKETRRDSLRVLYCIWLLDAPSLNLQVYFLGFIRQLTIPEAAIYITHDNHAANLIQGNISAGLSVSSFIVCDVIKAMKISFIRDISSFGSSPVCLRSRKTNCFLQVVQVRFSRSYTPWQTGQTFSILDSLLAIGNQQP